MRSLSDRIRQLSISGYAFILLDKLLLRHALVIFDRRIVQIRLQHNSGEGQDESHVCRGEGIPVLDEIPLCKLLHQAINLLRLTRQPKATQEVSDGNVEGHSLEVHHLHVLMQYFEAESSFVLSFSAQILSHSGLIQPILVGTQECSHSHWTFHHVAQLE